MPILPYHRHVPPSNLPQLRIQTADSVLQTQHRRRTSVLLCRFVENFVNISITSSLSAPSESSRLAFFNLSDSNPNASRFRSSQRIDSRAPLKDSKPLCKYPLSVSMWNPNYLFLNTDLPISSRLLAFWVCAGILLIVFFILCLDGFAVVWCSLDLFLVYGMQARFYGNLWVRGSLGLLRKWITGKGRKILGAAFLWSDWKIYVESAAG